MVQINTNGYSRSKKFDSNKKQIKEHKDFIIFWFGLFVVFHGFLCVLVLHSLNVEIGNQIKHNILIKYPQVNIATNFDAFQIILF